MSPSWATKSGNTLLRFFGSDQTLQSQFSLIYTEFDSYISFPEIDKVIFKFFPRGKTKSDMMWMPGEETERRMWEWRWLISRGAVIKHQCVHLSCSWEEGPSPPFLPFPAFMLRFFPPRERTAILGLPVCPLRRGQGRKIWPAPSVPAHLSCNQQPASELKTPSWWQTETDDNPKTVEMCMKWKRALMGWPQTCRRVLCWDYHSDGDLSHSTALMSVYTGKRSVLIITLAHYGWMRSFTEGGVDPIIDLSN